MTYAVVCSMFTPSVAIRPVQTSADRACELTDRLARSSTAHNIQATPLAFWPHVEPKVEHKTNQVEDPKAEHIFRDAGVGCCDSEH